MNKPTSDELRDQIATAGRALTQVREDVALFDRIKNAASEVTRLQALATDLTSKLNDALATEAKAELAAFAAKFRDLRVRREGGDKRSGIMGDTFVISYEAMRYNMDVRDSLWTTIEVRGFELLDGPLLQYILAYKPDLIDPDIKALAPGDVFLAMQKFINGKQRGFLCT